MEDRTYVENIFAMPEGKARERRFREDSRLRVILPEVYRLVGVPQPPDYHPEGDALTHTLLAVRHIPEGADRRLAWAALLHDIGKAETTREVGGRIRAFGHDREGADLAASILKRLGVDQSESDDVLWLIRHHMFALSWQVDHLDGLSQRQWRFIADPRFPLLLDLMKIDALAALASPDKLAQVGFYRRALDRLRKSGGSVKVS